MPAVECNDLAPSPSDEPLNDEKEVNQADTADFNNEEDEPVVNSEGDFDRAED